MNSFYTNLSITLNTMLREGNNFTISEVLVSNANYDIDPKFQVTLNGLKTMAKEFNFDVIYKGKTYYFNKKENL